MTKAQVLAEAERLQVDWGWGLQQSLDPALDAHRHVAAVREASPAATVEYGRRFTALDIEHCSGWRSVTLGDVLSSAYAGTVLLDFGGDSYSVERMAPHAEGGYSVEATSFQHGYGGLLTARAEWSSDTFMVPAGVTLDHGSRLGARVRPGDAPPWAGCAGTVAGIDKARGRVRVDWDTAGLSDWMRPADLRVVSAPDCSFCPVCKQPRSYGSTPDCRGMHDY